jgi:hypothetical protein
VQKQKQDNQARRTTTVWVLVLLPVPQNKQAFSCCWLLKAIVLIGFSLNIVFFIRPALWILPVGTQWIASCHLADCSDQ